MSTVYSNPLEAIETTPELTSVERRKRATMMGAAGMMVMPHKKVFGFFGKLSKGVGGRIVFGVLCAMIAGAIKDAPAIWHALKVLCAFIGLMGDARIVQQAADVLGRATAGVPVSPKQDSSGDPEGEKPKRSLKEKAKDLGTKVGQKSKEVARDTSEAIGQKVKPIEQDARKAVDEIKDRLGPPQSQSFLVNPPPPNLQGGMGGLVPFRGNNAPTVNGFSRGVQNFGNGVAQAANGFAAAQAQVAAEHEVYLRWWAENCPYNGQCVKHHGHKVPPKSKLKYHCYACGPYVIYSAAHLRSLGPPPPPTQKPRQFYAWLDGRQKQAAEKAEAEKKETP